jgi:hypothetical protein
MYNGVGQAMPSFKIEPVLAWQERPVPAVATAIRAPVPKVYLAREVLKAPAVVRESPFHHLVDVCAFKEAAVFRKLGLSRHVQRSENEGEDEPARRRPAEQEDALSREHPRHVHSFRGDPGTALSAAAGDRPVERALRGWLRRPGVIPLMPCARVVGATLRVPFGMIFDRY